MIRLAALFAVGAIGLSGCYRPIVVERINDPGNQTEKVFGIAATKMRITLHETSMLGLELDEKTPDMVFGDTTDLLFTVTNKTDSPMGYVEVRCRQLTADGEQVSVDYTNFLNLDAGASQHLLSMGMRINNDTRNIECRPNDKTPSEDWQGGQ